MRQDSEKTEFVMGNVVQLLSGGVPMTVEFVNGNEIDCRWFTPNGDLKSGKFYSKTLRMFSASERPLPPKGYGGQ